LLAIAGRDRRPKIEWSRQTAHGAGAVRMRLIPIARTARLVDAIVRQAENANDDRWRQGRSLDKMRRRKRRRPWSVSMVCDGD
jgi:hypothetical protein